MSQQSVADILRRISSRSYDALRRFDVALPHSQPSVRSKELTIIQTPFPYPASIIPSLLKEGVTTTFADLASRVYLQSALLLKRECERQVQQVTQAWVETRSCSSDANIPTQVASLRSLYLSMYKQGLESFVERILTLVRSKLVLSQDKRGAFNKEVIPILERFYSKDPFPSSDERRELAQQTKLTLEQVRIWFQNRRARARRSGQTPMKKTKCSDFVTCRPSDSTPSDLESEINRLIQDEVQRSSSVLSPTTGSLNGPPDNAAVVSKQHSVLWPSKTPDYAYPSPYHPTPESDPWASILNLTNFDIPWIREPYRLQSALKSIPDISDVADSLALLSINDGDTRRKGYPKSQESSNDSIHPMWTLAVSTAVLPPSPANNLHTSRSKRSLPARLDHWERGTLPPSRSKDIYPRLKPYSRSKPQPSLPRRIPQSQPQLISYRRSSSSRSSSTSSFESDDSSSSYASSSDSELGTPPPISMDLPTSFSENGLSPCISPISLPKLSKALSQSISPRRYTFRTTIARL